jgi:hypothetical protein
MAMNPTVIEIVRSHLAREGYDGLYSPRRGCACRLADLAPCGEIGGDCWAGYETKCEPETCPIDGDCDFHIANQRVQPMEASDT